VELEDFKNFLKSTLPHLKAMVLLALLPTVLALLATALAPQAITLLEMAQLEATLRQEKSTAVTILKLVLVMNSQSVMELVLSLEQI
jgi:hypothetical protein